MTIGPAVSTVTITGNFVDFEGTPVAGQVKFTLGLVLRNSVDDKMIVPSTVAATLDSNGSFSQVIPATNDPDVTPQGFTFTVEEAFPRGRTYTISVPFDTVGSLDLVDLSPDPIINTFYIGLVLRVPWDALVSLINAFSGTVDVETGDILFSGEYVFLQLGYASFADLNAAFGTYSELNVGPYPVSGAQFAAFETQAENAAISAANSLATATSATNNLINSLLLIGG
jgi:hypothetical protein